jgi:hypothetical protein
MNLMSDLGNELALAVLIEKKHSEKISSKDILPLIKRLKDALQAISSKKEAEKFAQISQKVASNSDT